MSDFVMKPRPESTGDLWRDRVKAGVVGNRTGKDKDGQWKNPELARLEPEALAKAVAAASGLHKELAAVFYTNKDKINELLRGKSPDEMHAIQLVYKDSYKKNLTDEITGAMSGKDLTAAQTALAVEHADAKDAKQLRASAFTANLLNADGILGADKDKIRGVLQQINDIKDLAERNEILKLVKAEFRQAVQSGDYPDSVKKAADPLAELVRENVKENRVWRALKQGAVSDEIYEKTMADHSDRDAALALVEEDGKKAREKAAAEKLKENLHGGLLHGLTGHDSQGVIAVLEGCASASERQRVLDEYKAISGGKSLLDEVKGTERDIVEALTSGDGPKQRAAVRAAKMQMSTEHTFADRDAMMKELMGRDVGDDGKPLTPEQKKQELAEAIAAYDEKYGQEEHRLGAGESVSSAVVQGGAALFAGPAAYLTAAKAGVGQKTFKGFDALIDQMYEGKDLELKKIKEIRETGKASDESRLEEAIEGGFFAKKDEIKDVLKDRSPAEVDDLCKRYLARTGKDLRAEIREATGMNSILGGGRSGHDIDELMKGSKDDAGASNEQKAKRLFDREQSDYRFERSGLTEITDTFSRQGFETDAQHEEFQRFYADAIADKKIDDEELRWLQRHSKYGEQNVKDLREAKDTIANNVAMAAAAVGGVVATVLSAGTLGPAATALVTALASGASEIAAKLAVQGNAYSTEDLQTDGIKTLLSAATGGAMAKLGPVIDKLLKIAPGAAPGLFQKLEKVAIEQGLSGLSTGAGGHLANRKNWEGKGVLQVLAESGQAGLDTARSNVIGGVVNTTVGHALEKPLAKLTGHKPEGAHFNQQAKEWDLHGGIQNMVVDTTSTVITTELTGGELSGDTLLIGAGSSLVQGMGNDLAEKRKQAAEARKAQLRAPATPAVEEKASAPLEAPVSAKAHELPVHELPPLEAPVSAKAHELPVHEAVDLPPVAPQPVAPHAAPAPAIEAGPLPRAPSRHKQQAIEMPPEVHALMAEQDGLTSRRQSLEARIASSSEQAERARDTIRKLDGAFDKSARLRVEEARTALQQHEERLRDSRSALGHLAEEEQGLDRRFAAVRERASRSPAEPFKDSAADWKQAEDERVAPRHTGEEPASKPAKPADAAPDRAQMLAHLDELEDRLTAARAGGNSAEIDAAQLALNQHAAKLNGPGHMSKEAMTAHLDELEDRVEAAMRGGNADEIAAANKARNEWAAKINAESPPAMAAAAPPTGLRFEASGKEGSIEREQQMAGGLGKGVPTMRWAHEHLGISWNDGDVQAVLRRRPGSEHLEVVPDGTEHGPNQIGRAKAEQLLEVLDSMGQTPLGREAAARLGDEGAQLTRDVDANGSFQAGKRIQLDPRTADPSYLLGTAAHEAHHLATAGFISNDLIDGKIDNRKDFVDRMLGNEAEAQSRAIRLAAQMGEATGQKPTPQVGEKEYFAAYDAAYTRAATENPRATPRQLEQLADQAGTDALKQLFGHFQPSTSFDKEGKHIAGMPKDYLEHYGNWFDAQKASGAMSSGLPLALPEFDPYHGPTGDTGDEHADLRARSARLREELAAESKDRDARLAAERKWNEEHLPKAPRADEEEAPARKPAHVAPAQDEEVERVRRGPAGRVRGEAELSSDDVAHAMNAQLQHVKAGEVDDIVQSFPPEQREQARAVLARSSQFGNMESLNSLRTALQEHIGDGKQLFIAGSGSLADNMAYMASKGTFDEVRRSAGDIPTTTKLGPDTVVVLDAVVLHRIKTDPEFVQSLVANNCALIEPRGFNSGINMHNAASTESVEGKTKKLLDRAQAIHAERGGKEPFDDAVSAALDESTRSALRKANPDLLGQLQSVDAVDHPDVSSAGIAGQLNGKAGISGKEIEDALARLPEADRPLARELLARQSEVYSPRRFAIEVGEQHARILETAKQRGVAPEDIYFYLPEAAKSYGMMAMVHRDATGTPVGQYINGEADLKARKLGPKAMVVVLDDVAGSGNSLEKAVVHQDAERGIAGQGFEGNVLVSPMLSSEMANTRFKGGPGSEETPVVARRANTDYEPAHIAKGLQESEFYQSLAPEDQQTLLRLIGHRGFGDNALSTAFPYMAPDNNNAFFGDLIAKYFIANQNRGASKSKDWKG